MRDRNNQNGSSQTPFSGILYKLKVSLFANKLTNWYFPKSPQPALPVSFEDHLSRAP